MLAPAKSGTRYCATRCRRCQVATSGGVCAFGIVASCTSTRSPRAVACSVSLPIRLPLYAANAVATVPATAVAAWAAPARPTPCCTASRPLLMSVSREPATRTAPIPSHWTGANRCHADSATRTLSTPSRRSAPDLFTPATPITDPPNHSAAPRSWTDCATVWLSSTSVLFGMRAAYPRLPVPCLQRRPAAGRSVPGAAGLHPHRLASHLRGLGRVRQVAQPAPVVPLQDGLEPVRAVVQTGVRVAVLREEPRYGAHVEVFRRDVRQRLPGDRHRHRRPGPSPHRPRRGDRPVPGGLVVVEEHALAALLLPPRHGRAIRNPFGDPPADRDHRVADVDERPLRPDPHGHMDAASPGGLGPADEAGLVEHLAQYRGDGDGVGEVGAGLRVEVDPQLVGVVGVGTADRPRVEVERAEVRRPDQHGLLGGTQRLRGAAAGEGDGGRLGVGRGALRHALDVERLAGEPVDIALEVRRPLVEHVQQRLGDGRVVGDDLALGDAALREVDLVRAGQPHLARSVRAGHRQQLHLSLGGHPRDGTGRGVHAPADSCPVGQRRRRSTGGRASLAGWPNPTARPGSTTSCSAWTRTTRTRRPSPRTWTGCSSSARRSPSRATWTGFAPSPTRPTEPRAGAGGRRWCSWGCCSPWPGTPSGTRWCSCCGPGSSALAPTPLRAAT